MKQTWIPAYKVNIDNVHYIYDKLKRYNYYMENNFLYNANNYLRKNETAYIVLNYKNKLGFANVVCAKSINKCNRMPISNTNAFLTIANQLLNGGYIYHVTETNLKGNLKNYTVKQVQSLIDFQYATRGFSCIEIFQDYEQTDNMYFGVKDCYSVFSNKNKQKK